jgi:hypothetical protein
MPPLAIPGLPKDLKPVTCGNAKAPDQVRDDELTELTFRDGKVTFREEEGVADGARPANEGSVTARQPA